MLSWSDFGDLGLTGLVSLLSTQFGVLLSFVAARREGRLALPPPFVVSAILLAWIVELSRLSATS
jgi:hypothetical protein